MLARPTTLEFIFTGMVGEIVLKHSWNIANAGDFVRQIKIAMDGQGCAK